MGTFYDIFNISIFCIGMGVTVVYVSIVLINFSFLAIFSLKHFARSSRVYWCLSSIMKKGNLGVALGGFG